MSEATGHIDTALEAIDRLDRLCCDPGRSPRIARLRDVVESARLHAIEADVEAMSADLASAGGMLGELQVACCAPGRSELYAKALVELGGAQRAASPMH